MTRADEIRRSLIGDLLHENKRGNNRLDLSLSNGGGNYREIITLDEIKEVTSSFQTQTLSEFLDDFVHNRLATIFEGYGYSVGDFDAAQSDHYDGYELNVPLIREYRDLDELFTEIDSEMGKGAPTTAPTTAPPQTQQSPQTSVQNPEEYQRRRKMQNPKRVDFIIKTVFDQKFNEYELATDAGKWKVSKVLSLSGKLFVIFESKEDPTKTIELHFFPNDSNKINYQVKDKATGKVYKEDKFEIYQIPRDEEIAEKFFRKTVFNLLKKFIDTIVVRLEPFNTKYVFWFTDNPSFSYSFSTPNKNTIVLDLIRFMSTAKKPILDDFFEQNNLLHKQGYLQTLLDAAEAAGIFRFRREGNEILIIKGPTYKAFLDGKLRREM